MKTLLNKRILLGVTGGIAAYKSADLARRLCEQGAQVRVVLTRAACEFITPLTMQAVSGHPVHTELLSPQHEAVMSHIELARWSDVILIAPATAHFIAKLAHGLADDLLSTLCLAADVPLVVAPAMNRQMWSNQATVMNMQTLQQRGIIALGPASGGQACGETGPGRMLEPEALIQGIVPVFSNPLMQGISLLLTAGPTQEAIDPVRFLSNRSSGRMGYAICQAALDAGAGVTLVSGPVSLPPPERARVIVVRTATEMYEAVLAEAPQADIFIAAAAVADYRCARTATQKIKKNEASLSLELEKNPDILAAVASLAEPPFTVGFAAETEFLQENAMDKLQRKGLDMVAANLVGEGLGFETPDNTLEIFWHGGHKELGFSSKEKLARNLINLVTERYNEKNKDKSH
jgi:phosphopantothenoylcysteine decarboxylase/phosphopantothenate--cysteine ligase